jgi:hypothetical protein
MTYLTYKLNNIMISFHVYQHHGPCSLNQLHHNTTNNEQWLQDVYSNDYMQWRGWALLTKSGQTMDNWLLIFLYCNVLHNYSAKLL